MDKNDDGLYYTNHDPLALTGCGCAACVMGRERNRRRPRPRFPDDYGDYDGPDEIDLAIGEWK